MNLKSDKEKYWCTYLNWSVPLYLLNSACQAASFKGGKDLSAGVEFKVNKMFSAWLDVNNILNDKYERWHNYQVYGLNVLGGVRVNF